MDPEGIEAVVRMVSGQLWGIQITLWILIFLLGLQLGSTLHK